MATEPIDSSRSIRVRVHGTEPVVDAILKLHRAATGRGTLRAVLDRMCEQMARIGDAEVVSVYVGDDSADGSVVMRGNYGFPAEAVGGVRLRAGEGLTGFAAECQRPVSAATAPRDARFKPVPGLGEERFPAFVAVPLLADGLAHGVLVLQRREERRFDEEDIALATALSGAFTLAIEWHREHQPPVSPKRARSIRLDGVAGAPGVALGVAAVLPSFRDLVEPAQMDPRAEIVDRAFDAVHRTLVSSIERAPSGASVRAMIDDARLQEEMRATCTELGVINGLREVARRYALTPYQLQMEDGPEMRWVVQRAIDVEDFCLLVGCRAAGYESVRAGAVLMLPERLTPVMALFAGARRAAAVAVAGPVPAETMPLAILREQHIPLVTDVIGLFAWARPDDRVLVDGDRGKVRLNPTPGEVVAIRQTAYRRRRRRHGPRAPRS